MSDDMDDRERHPLIAEAIRLCGSQEALADAAGVEQQTISKLLNLQRRVTAEMAIAIDRATEGRIPRHALRPDLFDRPTARRRAKSARPTANYIG